MKEPTQTGQVPSNSEDPVSAETGAAMRMVRDAMNVRDPAHRLDPAKVDVACVARALAVSGD